MEQLKLKEIEMATNFILTDDNYIEFYVDDGWEIVGTAPNPYPSPYIFFSIKKDTVKKLTKEERRELQDNAHKYYMDNRVY